METGKREISKKKGKITADQAKYKTERNKFAGAVQTNIQKHSVINAFLEIY